MDANNSRHPCWTVPLAPRLTAPGWYIQRATAPTLVWEMGKVAPLDQWHHQSFAGEDHLSQDQQRCARCIRSGFSHPFVCRANSNHQSHVANRLWSVHVRRRPSVDVATILLE